jgi:hypothetical protein
MQVPGVYSIEPRVLVVYTRDAVYVTTPTCSVYQAVAASCWTQPQGDAAAGAEAPVACSASARLAAAFLISK